MISPKTYYLTADRENVVEEGDPKAQFLLVRAGMEIPDAVAEKHGISGDKKPEPASAPPVEPDSSPAPKNREDAMPKRRTRAKR